MDHPNVVVLFGATGDLARRKLLPGLLRLFEARLIPDVRVIGTSLEELTPEEFDKFAHAACVEFHGAVDDARWGHFSKRLHYVATSAGPDALAAMVNQCEAELGLRDDVRRLHYLSVPPKAALDVIHQLAKADLVERSRVIMEKPFGTDLASAQALNAEVHSVFAEDQVFRIDHFLGKEAAQNILAFRFANGLFEPIWNRNFIDHVQIDVPETLGLEGRTAFYEGTGAYRDMVVTHLMQVLAFMAMEPPTSLAPDPISDEKLKVFRSMRPIEPHNVVGGSTPATVARRSSPTTPTPRRSPPSRSRSTTGVGPACRSSYAPARNSPRGPGSSRSPSRSPRCRCSPSAPTWAPRALTT